jgi:hypothetical protein
MTEDQIAEILKEVYGYLRRLKIINESQWKNEVEPGIKSTAARLARLSDRPPA